MSLFQPGDRVLYCPFFERWRDEPCEAEVLSVDGTTVILQTPIEPDEEPEDGQLHLFGRDLCLLVPARRPFLDDVERCVAHRFEHRVGRAVTRFWIDQGQRSTGGEDDAALVALLKQMKDALRAAKAEADRALAAVLPRLRQEIASPDLWRRHYRAWLTEDGEHAHLRWWEAVHRDHPPDSEEQKTKLLEEGDALRDRSMDAADRLDIDDRTL